MQKNNVTMPIKPLFFLLIRLIGQRLVNSSVSYFRGKKFFFEPKTLFSRMTRNYHQTRMALRLFYVFSLFSSVNSYSWMLRQYSDSQFLKPLWVFGPASSDFIAALVKPVLLIWITGSLLSFLNPDKGFFRFLQASGLFFIVALVNSDGHFGHNMHGFLWISLAFLLLPSIASKDKPWFSRIYKYRYIQIFWFSQFIICTFYLMTGYWKVSEIIRCAINPHLICQLDKYILTNISAREALSYYEFAPFRSLFFKYPWIAFWSYMGTIWIHLVSLHFVFRLHLHRVFGFFRLIFHVGTFLFFGVGFGDMAFPVAVIFIFSPFCDYLSPKETLYELAKLPPFSWIWKLIPIKKWRNRWA